MKLQATIMLFILSAANAYCLDLSVEDPPAEVKRILRGNSKLLAVSSADLNGDRQPDYVLVTERKGLADEGNPRELLIAIKGKDGSLRVVKRNGKIVMCSTCGGGWGDPFPGDVFADTKTFTVQNMGGGGSRWAEEYTFSYSKRDNTWQLVEVANSSFDISDPENVRTVRYVPPRDYGKIDISDFDPSNFLGVGPK